MKILISKEIFIRKEFHCQYLLALQKQYVYKVIYLHVSLKIESLFCIT